MFTMPHMKNTDGRFTDLIDSQKRLLECPKYNVPREKKILHNRLLYMLYSERLFCVPYHSTWNMPHITPEPSTEEVEYFDLLIKNYIISGEFYS